MKRRSFLGMHIGVGAAFLAGADLNAASPDTAEAHRHQQSAMQIRADAAASKLKTPPAAQITTGDEERYADKRASFSKTLPHNGLGEVKPDAYRSFVEILAAGDPQRFAGMPRAKNAEMRLNNPQAAYAYDLAGLDSHSTALPMPPPFAGPRMAAEMGELYWMALTRDVLYREYESNRLIADAVADLNRFPGTAGPSTAGKQTPLTLFRGETTGDLVGPYISQFLWQSIPFGATSFDQREKYPILGQDFLVDFGEWLACQQGVNPKRKLVLDAQRRYIHTNRDLAEYVRRIFSIQPYLNAAMLALSFGEDALSTGNPYRGSRIDFGDLTFGGKNVVALLGQAALVAEKAAWYEKWLVHRRLRPEVFGARVHNELNGVKPYDIPSELLRSEAVSRVKAANGTSLLPITYPEGSPTHPSYPAAHATIAGACATVLKAFFNEEFLVPAPVQASQDGLSLDSWAGPRLKLGNEINKLASNISFGRDAAGVHYRSDSAQGLLLGEEHAVGLLCDYSRTYRERFGGFVLTRFNGKPIRIAGGEILETGDKSLGGYDARKRAL
jgi:hypothetical protein